MNSRMQDEKPYAATDLQCARSEFPSFNPYNSSIKWDSGSQHEPKPEPRAEPVFAIVCVVLSIPTLLAMVYAAAGPLDFVLVGPIAAFLSLSSFATLGISVMRREFRPWLCLAVASVALHTLYWLVPLCWSSLFG